MTAVKNKLHGLKIVGCLMMRLCSCGKEVKTYLLHHNDFGELVLCCTIINFKVTQVFENPNNNFEDEVQLLQARWAATAPHQNTNKSRPPCPDQDNWAAITNSINNSIADWFCNDGQGLDREHIVRLIFLGFKVNDAKQALPGNIEPDVAP